MSERSKTHATVTVDHAAAPDEIVIEWFGRGRIVLKVAQGGVVETHVRDHLPPEGERGVHVSYGEKVLTGDLTAFEHERSLAENEALKAKVAQLKEAARAALDAILETWVTAGDHNAVQTVSSATVDALRAALNEKEAGHG
jgi:hypothetical protein